MRKRTFKRGVALLISLVLLFGMTYTGVPTFAGEVKSEPVESLEPSGLNDDQDSQKSSLPPGPELPKGDTGDPAGDANPLSTEDPSSVGEPAVKKDPAIEKDSPVPEESKSPEDPAVDDKAGEVTAPSSSGETQDKDSDVSPDGANAPKDNETPPSDTTPAEPDESQEEDKAPEQDLQKMPPEEPPAKDDFVPANPDHLKAPDDSPYAGKIRYDIYPATPFAFSSPMRSSRAGSKANGSPHPTQPGEVMLFKQATPVDGMVNVWDITLRIEGKDKPVTSDIILVMDTSGSMSGTRITKAKQAANKFIDTLLPSDVTRIGIVNFDFYAHDVQALTNNVALLKAGISGLQANGGTFTQAGVKQAEAMLANSNADCKHIVLLSDGEPTYSYALNNPDNYLIPYGKHKETSTLAPSSAYLYGNNNRVGNGSDLRWKYGSEPGHWEGWTWVPGYDKYYNHGNSAIAEAGFAKSSGYRVWTIALEVNATGQGILQQMASPNSYFTASAGDLEQVFATIAGEIGAAVKEAKITDPMGAGFQIPFGEVSNMTSIPATPAPVYDPVAKRITWSPGTLTTELPGDSTIKYAELKYRVELNDDILTQTPDENEEYPTNGNAKIEYKDANGNSQTQPFPVPKVNPVLYKVVKVLQDKDGNVITADRNFTIDITGPWGKSGATGTKSFTLNTSTQSSTKLLTDLRWAQSYTFDETGTNVGSLADYEIKYYVNGDEQTGVTHSFTIVDGNTDDVEVKVVNKEKPGTLTITKVLDQSVVQSPAKRNGTKAAVSFSFTVTGPDAYLASFNLPDTEGSWTKQLTGLAKGAYTVTETTTGWTTTYQVNDEPATSEPAVVTIDVGALNQTVTVTNKQTVNMTVTANKNWSSNAPTDKPDIWFQLLRVNPDNSTTSIGLPRLVPALNEVTWNQTDDDVNAADFVRYAPNGNEYVYKVQEVDADGHDYVPAGYSKLESGLQVTNTFHPIDPTNITSLRFEKTWAGVPAGVTPPTITVQVKANGEVYRTGNLTYPDTVLEWKNLPLNGEGGTPIVYTVEELPINNFEEGDPTYTESSIEAVHCTPHQSQTQWPLQNPTFVITRLTVGGNEGAFVVWTLNHVPSDQRIPFLWNVINNGPDEMPLKKLKQYLNSGGDYFLWYEGATVNEDVIPGDPNKGEITINITFNDDGTINTSTLTFQGESTWTHFAVGGYSSKLAKITNTYKASGSWTPEVTKVLTGRDLVAGEFSFTLTGNEQNQTKTNALDGSVTFDAIPYTQADIGKTYIYTITEIEGDLGGVTYDDTVVTVSVAVGVDSSGNLTFSPTYSPEAAEFNNDYAADDAEAVLSGTKKLAGRDLAKDEFTFELYASDADGNIADGAVALASTTNDVLGAFSFTLTYEDGEEGTYYYAVKEVKGNLGGVTYDTSVLVYKVVVTDDGAGQLIATVTPPEDTTFNNSYAASGSWTPEVTKVLVGRELKADEFSFRLKDSDDNVLQTKMNALDGKVTFDAISYTQDDIGETYTYTIVEVVPGHPECGMKYDTATVVTVTVTVKDAGEGKLDIETEYSEDTEFNNSYEPEMIDIHGEKSWDDNNDQDGIRPDSITINLYKKVGDGEVTFVDSQTVKADENGKWAWTFADLHKYDDWVEIEYSVTEEAIPGYTPTIDGYNIENKHEPSKIAIKVTKVWLDNDDEQGIRPDSLTIRLYADDIDTGKTLELTADGNWTGMFSDLDEFKEGVKIVYSVEEEGLDDRYDFDEVEGNEEDGFVITNSLVLSEAVISVWVDKTWDDANNKDGIRPDAITIRLFADGEEIDSMEITKADGWEGAFLELPKYKDGVEIVYTIQEDDVEGYTSEVDGYVVTNTHTPSKITIDVTKSWVDNNNEAGMRPKSVTIKLLANGKATGKTLVLTEDVNWKGTFSDLDEYKDGVKIVYTVQEQDIAGYTAEVTGNADKGFVVRNCPVLGEKDDKVPTTGESKSIYWMLGIGLLVVGAGALLLIILRKKAKPKS